MGRHSQSGGDQVCAQGPSGSKGEDRLEAEKWGESVENPDGKAKGEGEWVGPEVKEFSVGVACVLFEKAPKVTKARFHDAQDDRERRALPESVLLEPDLGDQDPRCCDKRQAHGLPASRQR
jgi:hypothetical protein